MYQKYNYVDITVSIKSKEEFYKCNQNDNALFNLDSEFTD